MEECRAVRRGGGGRRSKLEITNFRRGGEGEHEKVMADWGNGADGGVGEGLKGGGVCWKLEFGVDGIANLILC